MSKRNEPCMCGDPYCPVCGRLQGTYPEHEEPDTDALYERERQKEVDQQADLEDDRT